MDLFKNTDQTLTSPATDAQQITPNDSDPLPVVSRAIYVGGTGDLSVEMQGGQVVTYANVPAGTVLAVRALRVRLTGTSATSIVALW